MDLILWRHAEAEDGPVDLERRLTWHGRRQAERTGAWLASNLPGNTRIIVSPAVRAQETAQAMRRPFETSAALAPGATPADVLGAAQWPDAPHPALVVAHQPTLGAVLAALLSRRDESWVVGTCAAWWLSQRDGAHQTLRVRAVVDPDLV